MSALPPPLVPPEVYDEAYYRDWCAGGPGYHEGCLARIGFNAGEVLVDLGCGRGELVAVAIEQGAARAIGVEYSEDAIRLSHRTLTARGHAGVGEILHADTRDVPVADRTADLVTLLDVVEHLAPAELDAALAEAMRILKPGGRCAIHTLPNRLIYDVTYRLQRRLVPGRARRWPADPRFEVERVMHVNEQTRRSLRDSMRRAGFEAVTVTYGRWIHDGFVPDERPRRLYRWLARLPLTRPLGAADLWAEGRRPVERVPRSEERGGQLLGEPERG